MGGNLTSVVIGVRNLTPFGIGAGDLNNYKLSRFLVYNTLMEIMVEIETLVDREKIFHYYDTVTKNKGIAKAVFYV